MNLNLSKFKKSESNDKSTTLHHPLGHRIIVAHAKLSPEFKKQLDELPVHMAKGGMSEPSKAKEDPGYPKAEYTEPQDSGAGNYLSHVAKPNMSSNFYPCKNPSCKSYGREHPNCKCYGMAEGGEVDHFCSKQNPHKQGCQYFKGGGDVQPPQEAPDQPAQQEPTNALPKEMEPTLPPETVNAVKNEAEPAPEESQPEQPEPITPTGDVSKMDPYAAYQNQAMDANQLMHNESNKFFQEVDSGQVKPKTMSSLFHDQSLPGKIGLAFGLIVGGAGAGLGHTDNAVLGMMQKQIDNDLAAQEKNQANRTNLMTINGHNLMNLANAGKIGTDTRAMQIAMAKSQANYYLYNQLAQQAMNITNPQQAQKAGQVLALMKAGMAQDNASAFAQAAGANALGQMLHGGQNTLAMKTGLMGPEMQEAGQDIEQKTLQGIVKGTANKPITPNDKEFFINKQAFDTAAQQYMDFANKYKGNWANLNMADRAKIASTSKALTEDLKAKFLASKPGATVGELNELQGANLIPNAASWNAAFNGLPKLNQIVKDSQIEANTKAKSYEVQYTPGNRQSGQGTPQFKIINGTKYLPGKHGWERVK